MARYSGEAFRAISACSQKARLNVNLWGMLCKLGISRTKPTRRGCRAGFRKQKLPQPPILLASSTPNGPPSCTLRSERDFISLSQDRGHLNISTWITLNIQVNTLDAVRQIAQTTTPALTFCNRQHLHESPNCERKTYPLEYHRTAWREIEITHKFNLYLEEHVQELSPSQLVKPRRRADFRVSAWLTPDRSRKSSMNFLHNWWRAAWMSVLLQSPGCTATSIVLI